VKVKEIRGDSKAKYSQGFQLGSDLFWGTEPKNLSGPKPLLTSPLYYLAKFLERAK
jgi:hypothetical protein